MDGSVHRVTRITRRRKVFDTFSALYLTIHTEEGHEHEITLFHSSPTAKMEIVDEGDEDCRDEPVL